jgi:hypothetical protein
VPIPAGNRVIATKVRSSPSQPFDGLLEARRGAQLTVVDDFAGMLGGDPAGLGRAAGGDGVRQLAMGIEEDRLHR